LSVFRACGAHGARGALGVRDEPPPPQPPLQQPKRRLSHAAQLIAALALSDVMRAVPSSASAEAAGESARGV